MHARKILVALFYFTALFMLTNCCTTKNGLREDSNMVNKKNAQIALPPGMAEIEVSIAKVFEKNKKLFCSAKVKQVKRYGPSTKPISVDSDIELTYKESYEEKIQKSHKQKSLIKLTVAQLPGGIGQELNNSWNIIKISDKEN